ncbi:MAG: PEP-CTERM sorting domain-containing protein [Phycisphaerae bacterium]|jgi:hypothetical protein|nr:PEP-CTERM sorting domain-containing protein [Phycisphaerae bacterium]
MRISNRSKYALVVVAAAVVLLGAGRTSHGQVSYDAIASWSHGYNTIGMDLTWGGNAVVPTATTTANGFTMTYDATIVPTYPIPDPPGPVFWGLEGFQSFRVGPVPVQASLTMHFNGKLVNGGGDADHPTTSLGWSAALYYDLDDNNMVSTGDVPIGAFSLASSQTVVGNGLSVINDTQTMTGTFILSPEYDYLLRYHQSWSVTDLPTVPMSSTLEVGGVTNFSGITMTLTGTPVPEPTTLCLLAGSALAVLRRRRR